MKDARKPKTFEEQNFVIQELQRIRNSDQSEISEQNSGNVPLEARSAFISTMGGNLIDAFDPRIGLLGGGSGKFQQYISCPVNIPFCNRQKCLNRYGQELDRIFFS